MAMNVFAYMLHTATAKAKWNCNSLCSLISELLISSDSEECRETQLKQTDKRQGNQNCGPDYIWMLWNRQEGTL